MPLDIHDDRTGALVAELAKLRGASKQDTVRFAVEGELRRMKQTLPLRERFAHLRADHPLSQPTGKPADKKFFDELSGDPG